MAYCRTRTLAWPPPQVFAAALAVAPSLGLAISQADPEGGHLYLNRPRHLGRFPRRYAVSVTDSGLGTTVVNINWHPTSRLPWPLSSGERSAARLCRGIRLDLGAQ